MTLIAVTSSRTSPGATSLAVGLASALQAEHGRSLLIEADPGGGVLAHRFGLAPAPSLATLASDIRNGFDTSTVWANTQDLRGVPCIAAPVDPRLSRSWIERVASTLGSALAELSVPVVLDLGWVDEGSASTGLAAAADTTVVVTRPDVAEVQALLFQIRRLEAAGATLALATVGDSPHTPEEVAMLAGIPLAAILPDDPKNAAALAGAKFSPRRLRRSLLWRTIAGLGVSLVDEQRLLATSSSCAFGQPLESLANAQFTSAALDEPIRAGDGDEIGANIYSELAPTESQADCDPDPLPGVFDTAARSWLLDSSADMGERPDPGSATTDIIDDPDKASGPGVGSPAFGEPPSPTHALPEEPIDSLAVTVRGQAPYLVASNRPLVIGRHSRCGLTLRDSHISREHCRIEHTVHGWTFTDLDSRNGSEINGWTRTRALLTDGDVISIGDLDLDVSIFPVAWTTTPISERACA